MTSGPPRPSPPSAPSGSGPAPAAHPAPGLRRAIRLHHATAMVVGTIIGASIFVQPSEITGRVPSPEGVAAVWLAAGVLTFLGALVCAELASTFPEAGGVYAYLREAFSPAVGFLWGWAMFWTMHTGIIAAISVVFGRYLAYVVPLGPLGVRGAAVGAVLLLSAVNWLGVRHGSNLQTAFTAAKVAAVLLMIVGGFALGRGGGGAGGAPGVPAPGGAAGAGAAGAVGGIAAPAVSPSDFLLALVAALFAFGGWHMVTYNAEETVDPRRTIPRALVLGVMTVTGLYLALNAAYFHVLPLEVVASSDRVAADAAEAVVGRAGGTAIALLVVFSTFGALSGIVLAGPRVYFAMARDGLAFRWLADLHPRRGTPHRAILLQAAWASVLVATESYRALFTRVIYTEWIFFGLLAVGVYVLRVRGAPRRWSMWGYPVTPALFAFVAFAVVVNQVLSEPVSSLKGLGFVALGLPVYYVWTRSRRRGTASR